MSWKTLPNHEYIQRMLTSSDLYKFEWLRYDTLSYRESEAFCRIAQPMVEGKPIYRGLDEAWGIALEYGQSIHTVFWRTFISLFLWPEYSYLIDCDPSEVAVLSKLGNDPATYLLPGAEVFNRIKLRS